MPLIPSDPWTQTAQSFRGLAGGLVDAFTNAPKARAESAVLRSQYLANMGRLPLLEAQTKTEGAQQEYYGAQTGKTRAEAQNIARRQQSMADAAELYTALRNAPPGSSVPADLVQRGTMGALDLAKDDPEGAMKAVKMMEIINRSGLLTDKATAQAALLGRPTAEIPVNQGQTLFGQGGNVLTGMFNAGENDIVYGPQQRVGGMGPYPQPGVLGQGRQTDPQVNFIPALLNSASRLIDYFGTKSVNPKDTETAGALAEMVRKIIEANAPAMMNQERGTNAPPSGKIISIKRVQ